MKFDTDSHWARRINPINSSIPTFPLETQKCQGFTNTRKYLRLTFLGKNEVSRQLKDRFSEY